MIKPRDTLIECSGAADRAGPRKHVVPPPPPSGPAVPPCGGLDCAAMNPRKRRQKLDEARQAFAAGDVDGAERLCQALLRVNRADVLALHTLAVLASARQDDKAAVAHLSRCTLLDPDHAGFHQDLGRVHALAGRYEAAMACLQRARQLKPAQTETLTDLADVLERSGQHERAWELLAPRVRAGQVDEDMAAVAMRLLDHAGRTAEAIALGQTLARRPAASPGARRFLLQGLGRLLEKAGDADAAFQAFSDAKAGENRSFHPAAYVAEIDAWISAYSAAALARLPRAQARSQTPVFVACMPRSGSTLVEQVLHAHPQAHGAGEIAWLHQVAADMPTRLGVNLPYPHCVARLGQADVDGMAADYLRQLQALAPAALRISNKHLLNIRHLGLVELLLPAARVIHIRRDPLDNGLACFMASLPPAAAPWASDLAHIGLALRQSERLMAHWRDTLSLSMLEVQYEDLVKDTEAQLRRIIDFCGLPWDERCLRFWEAERVVLTPSYNQVRQPIFTTALGRWRRYEAHLQPLIEALA